MVYIFLLSKRNKDKLFIVYLLCLHTWTTKTLALKIGRNKRYIKDLLKEIIDDFNYYLNETLVIKITSEGTVYIVKKNSKELLQLFYALKLAYLQESHEFKLLLLFLQYPKLSISDIAQNLYLSNSYIRRRIKKLNLLLSSFNFQIEYNTGKFQIIGNELSIRIFLYVLMNDAYHSLSWPYMEKNLPEMIDFQQSFHIIITILNKRKYMKNNITPLNQKSTWVISQMKHIYDFTPKLKKQNPYFYNNLKDAIIEDYFTFFIHVFAPNMIPKDIKITLGKLFMSPPPNINLTSNNISNKIIKELNIDPNSEKIILLVYYLSILDCFNEIVQQKIVLFEKLIFPPIQYSFPSDSSQYKNIMQMIHKSFMEEVKTDTHNNEKLQHYYCELIYTTLQIDNFPIVRIYLHFTKFLNAQDVIRTRIESIFNNNIILFTSQIEEADLIVTDSLNFCPKTYKEFIYFNTVTNKDQWELLLKKIYRLLLF